MARLVIVSNRVPISKARIAAAGGLAVALRAILKRGAVWFGWSGRLAGRRRAAGAGRGGRTSRMSRSTSRRRRTAPAITASPTARCGRCCTSARPDAFRPRDDRGYCGSTGASPRRCAAAAARRPGVGARLPPDPARPGCAGSASRTRSASSCTSRRPPPASQRCRGAGWRAIFAYDLVGFQTDEHARRLRRLRAAQRAARPPARARLRPAARARRRSRSASMRRILATSAELAAGRARAPGGRQPVVRALIVGVDRLDYSKGLPERLLGFEHLLQNHPDMAARSLYLQIAPSSREDVDAYQALRAVLDRWRPHQRQLRRHRLTPMLCVNRDCAAPNSPASTARPRRAGDAAARRHEPGGQGIRRRPGSRRSRRAGPLALRRRGRS